MVISDDRLSRLANYATITGFVGLLLSAAVFVYEVMDNRAEIRAQAREGTLAVYNELRLAAAGDAELVSIILKAWNCEELDSNEAFRYENYMSYLFYSGHAHFSRVQDAGGDAGIWSGSRSYYRGIISNYGGVRSWWDTNKQFSGFSPDFIRELEENLDGKASCPATR